MFLPKADDSVEHGGVSGIIGRDLPGGMVQTLASARRKEREQAKRGQQNDVAETESVRNERSQLGCITSRPRESYVLAIGHWAWKLEVSMSSSLQLFPRVRVRAHPSLPDPAD